MKNQWLIILLVILFSACSSTLFIKNNEEVHNELNKELENKKASITMINENEFEAEQIKISSDSISWIDSGTKEKKSISQSKVHKIVIKDYEIGTLQGIGIFSIPIILVQSLLKGQTLQSRYDYINWVQISLPIIGGLIGVSKGQSKIYILNNIQNEILQVILWLLKLRRLFANQKKL